MRNIFKKVESPESRVERKCKHSRLSTDSVCRQTEHFRPSTSSGYTLLFAMIVASIVLALGVSLLTISRKEFVLSSNATQSSNAFYAADSGLGCAEYWAGPNGGYAFSTSSPITPITCSSSGAPIPVYECIGTAACIDNLATSPGTNSSGNIYKFTFYVPFSTDGTTNQSCAAVTVERYYQLNPILGNSHDYTDITSAGYNIGYNSSDSANNHIADCSNVSPKKVNRTIELTY